ncbi:hypothetical protein pb186bvf_011546 [Paramecium bursaria]
MSQEHFTENEVLVIEKVKQVLNKEELQILSNLMRKSTNSKDLIDQDLIKQQEDLIQDSFDNNSNNKEEQHRKFLRKVPNFYLSMFKKWLARKEHYFECQFLCSIRDSKVYNNVIIEFKLFRFELGDLKDCFSKQHRFENKLIDLKPLFIEFLTKWAPKLIINNKKANEKNKVNLHLYQSSYIEHIEQLLFELKQEQPFKSYYRFKPSKGSGESQKLIDDDCHFCLKINRGRLNKKYVVMTILTLMKINLQQNFMTEYKPIFIQ